MAITLPPGEMGKIYAKTVRKGRFFSAHIAGAKHSHEFAARSG